MDDRAQLDQTLDVPQGRPLPIGQPADSAEAPLAVPAELDNTGAAIGRDGAASNGRLIAIPGGGHPRERGGAAAATEQVAVLDPDASPGAWSSGAGVEEAQLELDGAEVAPAEIMVDPEPAPAAVEDADALPGQPAPRATADGGLKAGAADAAAETDQMPDNLPRPNDLFVGRRAEIARCLEALDPDDRGWGVAIDGIGGIGKTALALEVARIARERAQFDAYLFATARTSRLADEGVRAETLAPSALDAIVRELARLLGDEGGDESLSSAARRRGLLERLRARRALLVLDNLETLTDEERGQIGAFLRKLPGTNKAIVTSRRRASEGAVALQLGRLGEREAAALLAELGQRDERVAAVLARAGEDGRRALYETTGGHPLALRATIGLVAQRGYALDAALVRLRDPARSADLYGRLFALAARALEASDRAVLSALAAFQAPASADALADAAGLTTEEVEPALERLVGLALVSDGDGGYYSLHPLTRAYVRAVLGQGSEVVRAVLAGARLDPLSHRKALRYWVDYARKYSGDPHDAHRTFDALEAEWPNLEAAAVALRELAGLPGPLKDQKAARMLNELVRSLFDFLRYRSYWDEQARLGEWAYEAASALGSWRAAGWRAYQVAWIHYSRGETDRAAVWADRTAEAMERAGTQRDSVVAVRLRGLVAEQCGDLAEAERLFTEALAIYRELGSEESLAIALSDLGAVAQRRKDIDRADRCYHQALDLAEKLGDLEAQATHANNLGLLALERGGTADARRWYERGLALAREVGRQDLVAYTQHGLARVLEAEWRYREAIAWAEQALAIREHLHDRDLPATQQLLARLRNRAGSR